MHSHEIFLVFALWAVGYVAGFFSSAPVGPINLMVIDSSMGKTWRKLFWFLAGVVTIDVIFASVALWGYLSYLRGSSAQNAIGLLGGLLLIFLGLVAIKQRRVVRTKPPADAANLGALKGFGLGAVLCGSNPAFLMFWVFVVNLVDGRLGTEIPTAAALAFLCGVALGDLTWFVLLSSLVRRGISLVRPGLVSMIRVGIAGSFIVFGSIAIARVALP